MKVRQPASGFAMVGIAVTLMKDAKGACQGAGIGITGVGPKAYRARGVEEVLRGSALDAKVISSAAARVTERVDVNSDLFASTEYRKYLAEVYARRAIEAAASRAK
jgi:carbon-monoxide dehydrogenase medium subunit